MCYNENDKKLQQFKIQGVHTIYIMYDGDKPGREASYKLEKQIEIMKAKNDEAENK